tara:strand:+ start:4526 stop:5374 length:849 start_codon:yes stop_codon:yes gene_type:complete
MENLDSLKIASKTLKKNRERLKFTTKEVALELRLDQKIIDNIEKGKFEKFNNYVFLKGYLKNYANFLGVKIDLPDIKEEKKILKKRNQNKKKIKSDSKIPMQPIVIGISILVFIFIFFIFQKSNPKQLAIQKSNLFEKKIVIQEKEINLKNELNNNETNTKNNLISKRNDELIDEIKILKADESNSIDKDINSNNVNNTENINNILSIDYNGDSWTEIIDSYGNIVFFELVKNGTKLKLNIDAPFEILLGNATVVNIKYNNIKVDAQYVNPENNVGKVKIRK